MKKFSCLISFLVLSIKAADSSGMLPCGFSADCKTYMGVAQGEMGQAFGSFFKLLTLSKLREIVL